MQFLNSGTLSVPVIVLPLQQAAFSELQKDVGKRKAELGVFFPFVLCNRSFLEKASPVRKVVDEITWAMQMEGAHWKKEGVVLLSLDSQSMFDINLLKLHLLINM